MTPLSTALSENALWHATSAEKFSAPPLVGDWRADLIVIGGGITGLAAALRASELGMVVFVLESNKVGGGASGCSTGLVNASAPVSPDKIDAILGHNEGQKFNALLASAPDQVFALIEKHKIACDPVRHGTYFCAYTPMAAAALKQRGQQHLRRDHTINLIDAETARARTGAAHIQGALFYPHNGTLQPLAYARGLARVAARRGARICEKSPATAIMHNDGRWLVRSEHGTIRGANLIIAANAYATGPAATTRSHFTPVNFFHIATEPLLPEIRKSILPRGEACWDGTAPLMSAFRLDGQGRLILGGIGGLDHPGGFLHKLWARRKIVSLFPQLRDIEIAWAWHGQMAVTENQLPRIIRLGTGGLCAFGYTGCALATVLGSALAQAVASGDMRVLPVPPDNDMGARVSPWRGLTHEMGVLSAHTRQFIIGS